MIAHRRFDVGRESETKCNSLKRLAENIPDQTRSFAEEFRGTLSHETLKAVISPLIAGFYSVAVPRD